MWDKLKDWRAERLLRASARAVQDEHNFLKAAELVGKAARIASNPAARAEQQMKQAEYLAIAGEKIKAVEVYMQAMRTTGEYALFIAMTADNALKRILSIKDDPLRVPSIIDYCLEKLRVEGPSCQILATLGCAYRDSGDDAKAIDCFFKVLELAPLKNFAVGPLIELGISPHRIPALTDPETGLQFPLQLGPFWALRAALGVAASGEHSIHYIAPPNGMSHASPEWMRNLDGKNLSIFLFPLEHDSPQAESDDRLSQVLAQSREAIRESTQARGCAEFMEIPELAEKIPGFIKDRFLAGADRYIQDHPIGEALGGLQATIQQPVIAFTLVTGIQSKCLKLRLTGMDQGENAMLGLLCEVVESVLQILDRPLGPGDPVE